MKANLRLTCAGLGAIGLLSAGWCSEAIALTSHVSAMWGMPNPGFNSLPVFAGVHTSTFLWGEPGILGGSANGLTFHGNASTVQLEALFAIGTLSYFNSTTYAGTGVESVPLLLTLTLDTPQPWSKTFQIDFEITTTVNNDDDEASADAVIPSLDIYEKTVNLDGIEHTLSLVGFTQGSNFKPLKDLKALEGTTMTATLLGKLTIASASVPEPSVAIGLGLLGFYCLLQRQNYRKN